MPVRTGAIRALGRHFAHALLGLLHCALCRFCGLIRFACACVRGLLSHVWCARACLECISLVAYNCVWFEFKRGLRASPEERCATTIDFESGNFVDASFQRDIREATGIQLSPCRFRICAAVLCHLRFHGLVIQSRDFQIHRFQVRVIVGIISARYLQSKHASNFRRANVVFEDAVPCQEHAGVHPGARYRPDCRMCLARLFGRRSATPNTSR